MWEAQGCVDVSSTAAWPIQRMEKKNLSSKMSEPQESKEQHPAQECHGMQRLYIGDDWETRAGLAEKEIRSSSTLNPTFFNTSEQPTMSSITRMSPLDLLSMNRTNLDPLTENYDLGFYLNYLTRWPSLFSVVKDRDAGVVGYSTVPLPSENN